MPLRRRIARLSVADCLKACRLAPGHNTIQFAIEEFNMGPNQPVIGRRNRIDLMSPAELAIRDAMLVVEDAGADPLLTDAILLLSEAKDKVSDFVDERLKQPKAP